MDISSPSQAGAPINRRAFVAAVAGTAAATLAPRLGWAQASGQPFRVAMQSFDAEQLDPARENVAAVRSLHILMYDLILELGEAGAVAPGLAESWTIDPGGLVWTFKLREGVQFHGGYGELTSEDVVYSVNRWLNPETTNTTRQRGVDLIAGIEAVDKYRFAITTKGPQPTLPYLLSPHQDAVGIVWSKKHLLEKGGDTFAGQTKALNDHPIGSGAYEFVSRQRGQSMTFAAVDNHWRAKPYIRNVEFLLIPDSSTQVAMFQSGEVDLISIDPDRAEQIKGSDTLEVRVVPETLCYAILVNGTFKDAAKGKPTTNVEVRHALSKAIDRKTIIATLLGGYGAVPKVPFALLAGSDGIDPAAYGAWADELAEFDPEGAKKQLAEAGYPDGFSGIKLYISPRAIGMPASESISLAITAQWQAIGVTVEPVIIDYAEFRPHLIAAADDPFLAGEMNAFDTFHRFTGEATLSLFYAYAANVTQLLKDDELDALLTEIRQTVDDKKRTELTTKAYTAIHNQWVSLPVVTADALFGVNKTVAGPWRVWPGWASHGRMIETIQAPAS